MRLPIFEGFKRETRFSRNAVTNILSFSLVKSEYDITYEGDAFIIHWTVKGYSDMVFKPHKSGLHVYDPDDPRDCFMETVESNMSLFTKRQIHSVNLVHNLQAGLVFPSNADMKWAIQSNLIKDCPVTVKDMGTVIKVWGPNIAMLKMKTVRTTPQWLDRMSSRSQRRFESYTRMLPWRFTFFCQQDTILYHLQSGHMLSVGYALEQ
jgi:hypothetical protein